MPSDARADGGVEATADPAGGPEPDPPLYRWGSYDDRLRSLVHTLAILVGAFIAANLLIFVALRVAAATGLVTIPPDAVSLSDLPGSVAVALTGLQFVGFYLFALAYLRWRGESLFDTSLFRLYGPDLGTLKQVVVGFVGLLAVTAAVGAVLSALNITTATNAVETLGRDAPALFLVQAGIALLLNGPAEELLVRGLLQGLFRKAYGVVPGIVLSAGLFSVAHFLALSGSGSSVAATLGLIFVLGVALGVIYEWSQNLLVPAVIHGVFNAVQFVGLYASAAG